MDKKLIERINELAKKKKTLGLNAEEQAEQKQHHKQSFFHSSASFRYVPCPYPAGTAVQRGIAYGSHPCAREYSLVWWAAPRSCVGALRRIFSANSAV